MSIYIRIIFSTIFQLSPFCNINSYCEIYNTFVWLSINFTDTLFCLVLYKGRHSDQRAKRKLSENAFALQEWRKPRLLVSPQYLTGGGTKNQETGNKTLKSLVSMQVLMFFSFCHI